MSDDAREFERDFALKQFEALRREIEQAQAEVFKILAGAVTILPLAQLLLGSKQLPVEGIELALPFITLVIALQFMSHQARILRCGTFIREQIEKPNAIQHGWETSLAMQAKARRDISSTEPWWRARMAPLEIHQTRRLDFSVMVAFIILFAVYYVISLGLVWTSSSTWPPAQLQPFLGWAVRLLLAGIGLYVFWRIACITKAWYCMGREVPSARAAETEMAQAEPGAEVLAL